MLFCDLLRGEADFRPNSRYSSASRSRLVAATGDPSMGCRTMLLLALAMVGQDLDDAAFAYAAVRAFTDHAPKFILKKGQLRKTPFDVQ